MFGIFVGHCLQWLIIFNICCTVEMHVLKDANIQIIFNALIQCINVYAGILCICWYLMRMLGKEICIHFWEVLHPLWLKYLNVWSLKASHDFKRGVQHSDDNGLSFIFFCQQIKIQMQIDWVGQSTRCSTQRWQSYAFYIHICQKIKI